MPVTQKQSLTTDHTVQECTQAAEQALTALHMNPVTDSHGIVGKKGSTLSTCFLWLFTPVDMVPVSVSVRIDNQGTKRKLYITVEDTYSVPIRIGWNGKLRSGVEATARGVEAGCRERLGTAPVAV